MAGPGIVTVWHSVKHEFHLFREQARRLRYTCIAAIQPAPDPVGTGKYGKRIAGEAPAPRHRESDGKLKEKPLNLVHLGQHA